MPCTDTTVDEPYYYGYFDEAPDFDDDAYAPTEAPTSDDELSEDDDDDSDIDDHVSVPGGATMTLSCRKVVKAVTSVLCTDSKGKGDDVLRTTNDVDTTLTPSTATSTDLPTTTYDATHVASTHVTRRIVDTRYHQH